MTKIALAAAADAELDAQTAVIVAIAKGESKAAVAAKKIAAKAATAAVEAALAAIDAPKAKKAAKASKAKKVATSIRPGIMREMRAALTAAAVEGGGNRLLPVEGQGFVTYADFLTKCPVAADGTVSLSFTVIKGKEACAAVVVLNIDAKGAYSVTLL